MRASTILGNGLEEQRVVNGKRHRACPHARFTRQLEIVTGVVMLKPDHSRTVRQPPHRRDAPNPYLRQTRDRRPPAAGGNHRSATQVAGAGVLVALTVCAQRRFQRRQQTHPTDERTIRLCHPVDRPVDRCRVARFRIITRVTTSSCPSLTAIASWLDHELFVIADSELVQAVTLV
jgi:hypothetical protein